MTARRILSAMAAASLALPGLAQAADPSASGAATARAGYAPGTVAIQLDPFVEGLDAPVFVTPDGTGDGLLYVVEQGGLVRIIAPDGTLASAPFLDISQIVTAGGEQGLLGLAFHPDYADNGRLFVYYTGLGDETATASQSQVVSEFHAANGVVDTGSERRLLVMADFANNHNGGMLAFDADGMLLIGTGDGGGAGDPHKNGQDVTQPLGKLLRIDVDHGDPYGVPVNDPDGMLGPDALPEIRATGLRNPWRYSVDRATGNVFIGDVGQDEWEEVDLLPAGVGGLNYGWSLMEGPACFGASECHQTGLTPPVTSYSHSSGDGCTIIGGYVYRGRAFPALTGAYLFGDYCQGTIWALSAADTVARGTATAEAVASLDGSLVSFGQDDAGELYVVDLNGRVLRMTAVSR